MKLIMENWRKFAIQEINSPYDESKYGPPLGSVDEFEEHLETLNELLLEGINKKYFLITEQEEPAAAVDPSAAKEKQSWLDSLKGSLSKGVQYLKSMASGMSAQSINRIISS